MQDESSQDRQATANELQALLAAMTPPPLDEAGAEEISDEIACLIRQICEYGKTSKDASNDAYFTLRARRDDIDEALRELGD